VQTCFVVKMSYNNSQSQYGYGNYPAGYPSEHSGYGYGGQASTPGSIPGFPTPQPAPVTATQTYGQYRQAQSVAQSADQSAARPADQANQLLGLLAAASCQQSRPAQPGSYPGYPTSNQVNYSGYSGQNTNYSSPTQTSRPGGEAIKRSANDNYQASLAPRGQSFKRSENDNYRASLAPRRNSSGNSNNAPLGSVENRGQKRSLGSGESNYRSGKGSSRSFGDFGPKKPRFSSYENWGKDDDLIKVEPTLIDKKFNFWNLPKSARILLVSNVPPEIAKPNPLFHLFSFYGDVVRVKILPHKTPDVALVEFETATQACIARNHLDQVQMKDHKLVVSFSRFGEIRASPGDEGVMEDFTGPDFDILRRFSKEDLSIVNLKRISGPKNCLHINNIPQGTNLDQVKALFENKGVPVQDMIAIKRKKSSGKIKISAAVVFLQVANTSDALIAMALVGGSMASKDIPAGLRVSFTESNISAERKKVEENKKMEVAGNNEPLN